MFRGCLKLKALCNFTAHYDSQGHQIVTLYNCMCNNLVHFILFMGFFMFLFFTFLKFGVIKTHHLLSVGNQFFEMPCVYSTLLHCEKGRRNCRQ